VDVLSSRFRLRPSDLDRSRRLYRDVLGLAVYREFGPPGNHGVVFFLAILQDRHAIACGATVVRVAEAKLVGSGLSLAMGE
jgi:catechol 2,3-dioxygenase-like lactoylglutathione lyase family enzyme